MGADATINTPGGGETTLGALVDKKYTWGGLMEKMKRAGILAESPFVQVDAWLYGAVELLIISDDFQSRPYPQLYPAGPDALNVPLEKIVLWKGRYEPVVLI
jgi:hypothetical protein